ncbi:MAG: hypothetical protein DRN92_01840 [Thermoproteota archaeon]|nr:MAG: hypothetical protein DRN92_01840 [Candidatus Korarchaeota archaeon]
MEKGFDENPFSKEEIENILRDVKILGNEHVIISSLLAKVVKENLSIEERRRASVKLAEYMAFVIADTFPRERFEVVTPMKERAVYERIPKDQLPILIDILGASVYPIRGFETVFEGAPHAIISAKRTGKSLEELKVEIEYERIPKISGRPIIFIDPAIATGFTMLTIYRLLKENKRRFGDLGRIIVCGFVAAPFGIKTLKEEIPKVEIYVGSVSLLLNEHCYIHGMGWGVGGGGIGDAGDRLTGVQPVKSL